MCSSRKNPHPLKKKVNRNFKGVAKLEVFRGVEGFILEGVGIFSRITQSRILNSPCTVLMGYLPTVPFSTHALQNRRKWCPIIQGKKLYIYILSTVNKLKITAEHIISCLI